MAKMTLSEGQFLTKNFDFRGHISTFQAESTPKSTSFKVKNIAQTTSEHLQNNFQKAQKTGFFYIKNGQNDLWEGKHLINNYDLMYYFSSIK